VLDSPKSVVLPTSRKRPQRWLHRGLIREISCAFLLAVTATAHAATGDPVALDVTRADVVQFIQMMHDKNGFDVTTLTTDFADVRTQPAIIDAISRPAEKALAWYDYRARFITEQRISEGAAFWAAHRELLDQTTESRGVPSEIVLGILGVETHYGRIAGKFRVIDALSTLAFDYPPRSAFFRSELEQLLLLAREEDVDPRSVLGSYAGAMGAAQFIASSYRRYAIDANNDGKRDLWTDWADVFGSIANYLQVHGWAAGQPVLALASIDQPHAHNLDPRPVTLTETVASLHGNGVRFETPLPPDAPAMLLLAERPEGVAFRVGFQNFYTLTRYNHSPLYAMAVTDLAAELVSRSTAAAGQAPQAHTP
jgi:membrane-bound lytic murein transglycosylase B